MFSTGILAAVLAVGVLAVVRVCISHSRSETSPSLQLGGAVGALHRALLLTVAWAGVLVLARAWARQGDELTVFMAASAIGLSVLAWRGTVGGAFLTSFALVALTMAGIHDVVTPHPPSPDGYYAPGPILVDGPMFALLVAGPVLAHVQAVLFLVELRRRAKVDAPIATMTARHAPAPASRQADNRARAVRPERGT